MMLLGFSLIAAAGHRIWCLGIDLALDCFPSSLGGPHRCCYFVNTSVADSCNLVRQSGVGSLQRCGKYKVF
jgi:hypothetical protein